MTEEEQASEETGSREQEREAYREHWYFVADRIERVALRKDRLVVTGAGGALVLSITFLEQIAPNPEPWTLKILVASWVALLAALGLALGGLYATQRAHEKQQENLLERYFGDASEPENPWDKGTIWADRLAFTSLFVGVALLTVFAFINLPWEGSHDRAAGARPGAERITGGEASARPGSGGEGVHDSTSPASAPAGDGGGS